MLTRDDVDAAAKRIDGHVRRTPVLAPDPTDPAGAPTSPIWWKCEWLQHTGSFKTRGAFSNLLTRTVPLAGVVAASGGSARYAAMAWPANYSRSPRTRRRRVESQL